MQDVNMQDVNMMATIIVAIIFLISLAMLVTGIRLRMKHNRKQAIYTVKVNEALGNIGGRK